MANETTTTTANDITQSAVIAHALLGVAADNAEFLPMAREFDIVNEPANAIDVARPVSMWGSVPDVGAGVDTEFDATQGTALGNTAWSTDKVTGTATEFGIQLAVTDNVGEDSVRGIDIWGTIESMAMQTLMFAVADDMAALFASLSNVVGTTTVTITLAQLLSAPTGIRTRGYKAPNGVVFVLDNLQVADIEALLIAGSTSAAVYANSADRLLGYQPVANHGLAGGPVLSFRGYPVFSTGLTDTANAGTDVVGSCFTPSGPGNDPMATFGLVWKRLPRLEFDRDISARTTKMVLTMRCAPFELTDGSGCAIITDN